MTQALQASANPVKQPRRTQAERHAETHRKIIDATVGCIDELGYHQTTMQRVARQAGVTVGAVQHHFPSKSELLAAVLEDGFRNLSFSLENVDFESASLDQRISLFVDHCWEHCNSAQYQSNLHIMLGMRNEVQDFDQWLQETIGHVVLDGLNLWRTVFTDISIDEKEHFDLLLFIFSTLSGSAMLARINQQPMRPEKDLQILKQLLQLRFSIISQGN